MADMNYGGPQITPQTLTATGQGGQQQPPYLQARRPTITAPGQPPTAPAPPPAYSGQNTQPVVSPPGGQSPPVTPPNPNVSQTQQKGAPDPTPDQQGGTDLGGVYKFFKSDLENQRNQALASTRADASARGVFYGTPLTGSEADINTQYLRGLGQLQAGMYGNEQQNQLARLGLASNLLFQGQFGQPPMPGATDWSSLGSLFGQQPQVGGKRTGPVVTPPTPQSPQPITAGGNT